jgi:glutamyl-tRNA synthetase
MRNEDLDPNRSKSFFVSAFYEDLLWFGFEWQEGPDCGGPCGPYSQSERRALYSAALDKLRCGGFIYPCTCSRQDVLRAAQAPHMGEDEPIYPGTCRPRSPSAFAKTKEPRTQGAARINWRFRVPDAQAIEFVDGRSGRCQFTAGKDFGDFIVWRHDDIPSYQLAVVVDDAAMGITEVVRGEDLLKSTARQLLLYAALNLRPPTFYHCALVTDAAGVRLAKRHAALSLRALRAAGTDPDELRKGW